MINTQYFVVYTPVDVITAGEGPPPDASAARAANFFYSKKIGSKEDEVFEA